MYHCVAVKSLEFGRLRVCCLRMVTIVIALVTVSSLLYPRIT